MQTFVPYSDFFQSLSILDNKRLGKQRVETLQILNILLDRPTKTGKKYKGWVNHPAVILWENNIEALKLYLNISIDIWISKGFSNNIKKEAVIDDPQYPGWWGTQILHDSHKENLLRKDRDHYTQFFPSYKPSNKYIWVDRSGKFYYQEVNTSKRIFINV
jgi:hypothetical protein